MELRHGSPMRFVLALMLLLLPGTARADREEQWLYREIDGANSGPAAIFLSWNYTDVLFHVQCDRATGELIFRYFGDDLREVEPMELILGDIALPMRTTLEERYLHQPYLEGRLSARAALKAWTAESEVDILAPNEMGEPWYTGLAKPLRILAESCSVPH